MTIKKVKKIKKESLKMSFSTDNEFLAVASSKTVDVFFNDGKKVCSFRVANVFSMLFIHENQEILMINTLGKMFIGNISNKELEKRNLLPIDNWMENPIFLYNDTSIVTGVRGGIWLYDFEQNTSLKMMNSNLDTPVILKIEESGDIIYIIGTDIVNSHCPLSVFSLARGCIINIPELYYDELYSCKLTDNGNFNFFFGTRNASDEINDSEFTENQIKKRMREILVDTNINSMFEGEDSSQIQIQNVMQQTFEKMFSNDMIMHTVEPSLKSKSKHFVPIDTRTFYCISADNTIKHCFSIPNSFNDDNVSAADKMVANDFGVFFWGVFLQGLIATDFEGNELYRLNDSDDYCLANSSVNNPVSFVQFRNNKMYVGTWESLIIYELD